MGVTVVVGTGLDVAVGDAVGEAVGLLVGVLVIVGVVVTEGVDVGVGVGVESTFAAVHTVKSFPCRVLEGHQAPACKLVLISNPINPEGISTK